MTQSLTGMARNLRDMADVLSDLADDEAGMEDVERFVTDHQPRMLAFTVEELVRHLRLLRDNPNMRDEFFAFYVFEGD